MKRHGIIFGAALALIPFVMLSAKPSVHLAHPPPGRYGIEDLWKATVISDTACDAWFEGFVYEAEHGQVFHATTKPFKLPRGTKVYGYRDVRIDQTQTAPGYDVFVTRSGGLPQGNYDFKLTLQPFGVESGFEFEVKPMGPPRLISPPDGAEFGGAYPDFVWTAPANGRGIVTYRLRIVEVEPGQTKEEALAANPPWFEQDGIRSTRLRYPASARKLDADRDYAWRVEAETDKRFGAVSSEIRGLATRSPSQPLFRKIRPLKITRTVTRHNNWFLVVLELTNTGSERICNVVIEDNSLGFQSIDEVKGRFESGGRAPSRLMTVPSVLGYDFVGRSSTVSIDLSAPAWALAPGRTVRLSYSTLPVIHSEVDDASAWRVVGRHLRATYGVISSSDDTIQRAHAYGSISHTPAVQDIALALAAADYLIATAPGRLLWFAPGDIETKDSLLVLMARLAKAKRGALLYCDEPGPDAYRREILEAGARLGSALGVNWSYEGNLLLVGEQNIVPHFPPVTFSCLADDPLKLNDYPYANWTGDDAPELAVGRILGETAGDLMIPIQASLELLDAGSGAKFDRSHALFVSGHENGQWKFLRDMAVGAQSMHNEWSPSTGIDTSTLHTDFFTTKKRLLAEALMIPFSSGGAGIGTNSEAEKVLSQDQLSCWLLSYWIRSWFPLRSRLDELYPRTDQDKYFTYLSGPEIRVPKNFGAVGRTEALARAQYLKHSSPTRKGVFGTYTYYSDDNFDLADQAIKSAFRARAKNKDVIVWVGHSHPVIWGEILLREDCVRDLDLRSGNTRPVVIGSGCHTGDYDMSKSISRGFLKYGASVCIGAAVSMIGGDNDLRWDWWSCWKPWMSVGQGLRALKRFDMTHGPRMGTSDPEYDGCEQGEPLRLYLYQMNLYGDPKVGG